MRPLRILRWTATGLVVAALAGGAAVVVLRHRAAADVPAAVPVAAPATVKLERRDLSTTTSLPGTIGFGAARPLAGHLNATVTWLPAAGATIRRGQQLYRADDRPVPLFYGDMPLYRTITRATLTGRDVGIVAGNLRALGYRIGSQPSDGGKLTPSLIAAIKRWQADLGVPPTGQIAVGDVEVQSGAVRVDAVQVQPGSPAAAPLFTVTSTRKVITVPADLDAAASIERDDKVTVVLPDERTVKAHVLSVGRDLATPDGNEAATPKLTVTVTVDDPATIAKLDSAAVNVNFPGRTAKGVLAAPIEALVALTEGGYAVQGPHGLVAVQTGMFADGWVQISGPGLEPGTAVVVSS
jgi:peptidoglycan hydrolase-like protein with peptidoglycan-binding domain